MPSMPKALFLDRDGTINVDYGYVCQKEKFDFIDGIFELCRLAVDKGFMVIVITNQSGIARGYFTVEDFDELNQYMVDCFAKQNIKITDVFYCPELSGENRKPNCGMFKQAQNRYHIDMENSLSLGDKPRDIEAAQKAGVGQNFLFEGSYGPIVDYLQSL